MLAALALSTAITYTGHGVLVTGERPIAAYLRTSPAARGKSHLDIWQTASGHIIRAYDLNMTKLLHVVVVSDDLRDFRHIHPTLHPDGHFGIDTALVANASYHIYIDGDPHAIGRQVFRFDIGDTAAAKTRALYPQNGIAHAGPYTITLDTTSIAPTQIATIRITITKHGRPATDLHPYLGAMAHGVFIGVSDLAYMHGHGMSEQMLAMAANDCGDAMMLATPPLPPSAIVPSTFAMQVLAPRPQRYNLWLQFTGGSTLYTVPLTLEAPSSRA
jgi:hypothetical protein